MIAYREHDFDPQGPIREHPYQGADYHEGVEYYDFRKNPELIREKLEDFKPHDSHEGIKRFYEIVEWINTDESVFESNDCAFTPPMDNISPNASPKKLECKGRLMIFYRNLPINLNPPSTEWLLDATSAYIQHTDKGFQDGVIGLCFMDTAFAALNKQVGKELVLYFWAYGDTEEETYENLGRLFTNLLMAIKGVSTEIAEALEQQTGESIS